MNYEGWLEWRRVYFEREREFYAMIWSNNKLERVIQKSVLKRAKGVCVGTGQPITGCEGTASNLAQDIYKDILKEAKRDNSLYLELYL